jgi:hypothetical protein
MAVGVLAAAPEFTRQVYDNITEKMYGHSSYAGGHPVAARPLQRLCLYGTASLSVEDSDILIGRTLPWASVRE